MNPYALPALSETAIKILSHFKMTSYETAYTPSQLATALEEISSKILLAINELQQRHLVESAPRNYIKITSKGISESKKLNQNNKPSKPSKSVAHAVENTETNKPAVEIIHIPQPLAKSLDPYPKADEHSMRNGYPSKETKNEMVLFSLTLMHVPATLIIPIFNRDVLGRNAKKCTILFNENQDRYVADEHCKFEIRENKKTRQTELYVTVLSEITGMYVDRHYRRKGETVLLEDGVQITVGQTSFIVSHIHLLK